MSAPLLSVPVLSCTVQQAESFALLVLDYFARVSRGEPATVPAELMECAAASMVSQFRVDAAFNWRHQKEST